MKRIESKEELSASSTDINVEFSDIYTNTNTNTNSDIKMKTNNTNANTNTKTNTKTVKNDSNDSNKSNSHTANNIPVMNLTSSMPVCFRLADSCKDIDPPEEVVKFYYNKIGLKINIGAIESIDIASNPPSFRCKFTLFQTFRSNLVLPPGSDKESNETDGISRPGLVFGNKVDLEKIRETYNIYYKGFLVGIITEYIGVFAISSNSAVFDFPFDTYDCCMTLYYSSFVKLKDNLQIKDLVFANYNNSDNSVDYGRIDDFDAVHDQWSIFQPKIRNFNRGRPAFQFCFRIKRKFEVHISNGFAIIFIITGMNFAGFGIDVIDVASRLSFASTIALTLVALKFALESDMPKSSKANWIQKYNLLCILYTLSLMILFAVENKLDTDDSAAFIASICLFLVVTLLFCYVASRRIHNSSVFGDELEWKIKDTLSWI